MMPPRQTYAAEPAAILQEAGQQSTTRLGLTDVKYLYAGDMAETKPGSRRP
jgi:hypothetical protein